MKKRSSGFYALIYLAAAALFLSVSCSLGWNMRKDPLYETFLEKTSLIMLEEEIETYRHLADVASKREFIAEFWRIRDPNPDTEENEARNEFERRVAFANQWFDPFGGCRGHIPPHRTSKPVGWNTDRGRIFIVMGLPDSINLRGGWEPAGEDRGDLLCQAQSWYYERYRYSPVFGTFVILSTDESPPYIESEPSVVTRSYLSRVSTYTEVMTRAKMDWLAWEVRDWNAKPFQFKAVYEKEGILIRVPIEQLSFRSAADRLQARFDIEIHVYCQKRETEVLKDSKSYEYTEEDIFSLKNIDIFIPYQAKAKGLHVFDIIVAFETAQNPARYRKYVRKRF